MYAIAVDASGRVWVATDGGGFVRVTGSAAQPEQIRFDAVTRAQGLTSDTVYGIVPDMQGDLWLSGNSGLVRYDPQTHAVKTYHREQGVQGEEFSSGAFLRLRDGRALLRRPRWLQHFRSAAADAEQDAAAPGAHSRRSARCAGYGPDAVLAPSSRSRSIIAAASFRSISACSTSARRSTTSSRIACRASRISGSISARSGASRSRTWMPGDHVLEVRAANADSVWSETPVRVAIHRDPAPWRSPFAYAAYALLVLGIILYRVHRQRVKLMEVARARDRLESEVQLRTRELVESNRQLAEAARAKSDFLDRMSHELRTPMNGVVGMTELLARTALSATQTHLTKTISVVGADPAADRE